MQTPGGESVSLQSFRASELSNFSEAAAAEKNHLGGRGIESVRCAPAAYSNSCGSEREPGCNGDLVIQVARKIPFTD